MKTENVKLQKGDVTVMDYGGICVHVYNTRDAIDDQVIVLERPHKIMKGGRGVVIELPCFRDSIEEMTQYLKDQRIDVEGKLVAYHAAGDFLPGVKSYMTESAHMYNTVGGGKGLIDNFAGVFGDAFKELGHHVRTESRDGRDADTGLGEGADDGAQRFHRLGGVQLKQGGIRGGKAALHVQGIDGVWKEVAQCLVNGAAIDAPDETVGVVVRNAVFFKAFRKHLGGKGEATEEQGIKFENDGGHG